MPTLWAAGVQGQWDYLAIDLLGASLDNLYRKSGKEMMELGTVCSIAMQVVCSPLFFDCYMSAKARV
jgi:casein kinase 1